jgi:inositol transporter-like SP family MFS transporter
MAVTQPARLVLVAGSASVLDSAAIISVGSALPLWRERFDMGAVQVGVVSGSLTLAIAVGALAGGFIADRVGRSRVFALTLGVYAAGAAAVALAGSWEALVVGVVVLGLGSGADLPASIALVAERVPSGLLARTVAATHVLWTVGIVLASAAAFVVSPLGLGGMRGVFATLAFGALAVLVARRRARELAGGPPTAVAEPVVPVAGLRRTRARALGSIALFYVLYTLVANTFGSFRTYLFVTVGGTTQEVATAIAFAATLVGLVGTIVFSIVAGSPWRRRLYTVAGAGLVSSQALLAVTVGQSLIMTVAALLLYALAYPYVGEGLYKVWAQESARPASRASFQGATIAGARATAALFALVTPWLLARDPALLFWLLTAISAAAVLVGAGLKPPRVTASGPVLTPGSTGGPPAPA